MIVTLFGPLNTLMGLFKAKVMEFAEKQRSIFVKSMESELRGEGVAQGVFLR